MRDILISTTIIAFSLLPCSVIGEEATSAPMTQEVKVSLINWTGDVTYLKWSSPIDVTTLPTCPTDGTPPPLSLSDASELAVELSKKESKADKVWCVFGQLISLSPDQTPSYGTKPEIYAYLIALDVRDMPGAPADRCITFKIVFMDGTTASVSVVRKPI